MTNENNSSNTAGTGTIPGSTISRETQTVTRTAAPEIDSATIPEPSVADTRISRIEIAPGGAIDIVDDRSATRETVAEVTNDTFFERGRRTDGTDPGDRVAVITACTLAVNLDQIADAVRQAQRDGGQADPARRVYVGREGELLMGNEASGNDRIAEVTKDTFYASDRLAEEAAFVRSNMPRNTVRVSDGTYSGWHFSIVNEFGDEYGLFLYYHDGYKVYRVALVEPRLGGSVNPHDSHLWQDGTLCLTKKDGSGYKSIAKTYAKAALWTRGASCHRRGLGFQFNIGQD